jgi:hypothetical protein
MVRTGSLPHERSSVSSVCRERVGVEDTTLQHVVAIPLETQQALRTHTTTSTVINRPNGSPQPTHPPATKQYYPWHVMHGAETPATLARTSFHTGLVEFSMVCVLRDELPRVTMQWGSE